MHFSTFYSSALAAGCAFVNASPVHLRSQEFANTGPSLEARDGLDCTPHGAPTRDCYKQLNITGYLQDWWQKNGDDCANNENEFAACFIHLSTTSATSCSELKQDSCTFPDAKDYQDKPEVYYVLWNIFAINNYFATMWTALGTAHDLTDALIPQLVGDINPIQKDNVALNAVLTALSSFLLFIPVPGVGVGAEAAARGAVGAAGSTSRNAAAAGSSGGSGGISITASSGSSAAAVNAGSRAVNVAPSSGKADSGGLAFYQFFGAAQASPLIGRFAFPVTGTIASQIAQAANISATLAATTEYFQNSAADSIPYINKDFNRFLTFANTTYFTADTINLKDTTKIFQQVMTAAVIADIMVANNVVVTVGSLNKNTNPLNVYVPPSPSGLTGGAWVDKATNDSYSMTNAKDISKDYGSLIDKVIGQNMTTGDLLFKTAGGCPRDAVATYHAPDPSNLAAGAQVTCLINAPLCHYEQDKMDARFEFTDCPTQDKFAKADCPGNSDGTSLSIRMPKGYVGAYGRSDFEFC